MKSKTILILNLVLFTLFGCQAPTPPPPQMVTVTTNIPAINASPETIQSQEKGGVEIAVTPALYKSTLKHKYSIAQENPNVGGILVMSIASGGNSQSLVYIREQSTPVLTVEPDHLCFSIHINNKLSRVFRGQGTVVQFNVCGKLIPFGNTNFKELVNCIIPPRNESDFLIYGPSLSEIPDKGIIAIYLYDVVTATDVAGNITEKQNYEWYFEYSLNEDKQTVKLESGNRFVTAAEFQKLILFSRKKYMEDKSPTDDFLNSMSN
jgi:hypothetical protein